MALRGVPELRVRIVRITVPEEVAELVDEYREFLGGATTVNYIYAEAARREIQSDKRFKQARQTHGA